MSTTRAKQSLKTAVTKNPKLGLFVASLATNGGDTAAAAEDVGWKPAYGSQLLSRYPEIRHLVRSAQEDAIDDVRQRWAGIHGMAIRYLEDVLKDKNADPRIRLEAAKVGIERVEGRVRQAVDLSMVQREEDEMQSVRYRFALAVANRHGWELEQALQYADENQDQVQEWWESIEESLGQAAEA